MRNSILKDERFFNSTRQDAAKSASFESLSAPWEKLVWTCESNENQGPRRKRPTELENNNRQQQQDINFSCRRVERRSAEPTGTIVNEFGTKSNSSPSRVVGAERASAWNVKSSRASPQIVKYRSAQNLVRARLSVSLECQARLKLMSLKDLRISKWRQFRTTAPKSGRRTRVISCRIPSSNSVMNRLATQESIQDDTRRSSRSCGRLKHV